MQFGETVGDFVKALELQKNLESRTGGGDGSDANPNKKSRTENPYNVHYTQETPEQCLRRRVAQVTREKFAKVVTTTVVAPQGQNLQEWEDFTPGIRPCYALTKINTVEKLAETGKAVFKSLFGDVTQHSICMLLQLAYNLRDSTGHFLIGEVPNALTSITEEVTFDDISDKIILVANPITPFQNHSEDDDDLTAHAYCFLAAGILRLYTKDASHYSGLKTKFDERFQKFYNHDIPFENYILPSQVAKTIKSHFETNDILRNTFYNFLYASESVEIGSNIKDFLYLIHVAFTGMHAYSMFVKCMDAYKMTSVDLMTHCNLPCFVNEISNLIVLFENFFGATSRAGKERRMWRFARLFNNKFFAALQPRNCMVFVYMLAELYHFKSAVTATRDARKIAQLADITTHDKMEAIAYAVSINAEITRERAGTTMKDITGMVFDATSGVVVPPEHDRR